MAANLTRLEAVTLPLFRAGHLPVIGEWLALPLLRQAGSSQPGDTAYVEISYPVAHRLIDRCDAVLRLAGASNGADEDVRRAVALGLPVYTRLADVPGMSAADAAGSAVVERAASRETTRGVRPP
jgi:hypothetical protein